MKKIVWILLFSIPITCLLAQQKITLMDAVNPRYIPQRVPMLQWRPDTDSYTYLKGDQMIQSTAKGKEEVLFDLAALNKNLDFSLKRIPRMAWMDKNTMAFSVENIRYTYQVVTGEVKVNTKVLERGGNEDVASNGNLAFVRDGNLFVYEAEGYLPLRVSHDGNRELVYGEAAHRSEFGIVKGTFWSPSGKKLAFYRMDQTMVTDFPVINYLSRTAENVPVKYPMAGEKSHHATVGIYDLKSGTTTFLETGTPREQYLTNITWSPDEKSVYVAVLNRGQNEMDLNVYDAVSGEFKKTLFSETHEKYVEPEHGPLFLPNQNDQFIWQSEQDGFNHLYVYNTQGDKVRQLTKGNWVVTDVLGFDENGKYLVYMSTQVSPTERHAYRVDVSGGKAPVRITQDPGMHRCRMSTSGKYLMDSYSNLTTPGVYQIINTKNGKVTHTILNSPNPLADFTLGEMTISSLKGKGDDSLVYRLIKPVNFDPNKKYPAVVYVYGGPHVQLVQNSWQGSARLFLQYLAQEGYVVFTVDNRGTSARGLKFEQETFRRLGTAEMEDQLSGLDWLKKQSYVDPDRVGVYGWSYGGFMTTSLMTRSPGAFKVGVAGGPVIDWKYYEIMYTERYMDSPQENPKGYEESSLLNYAKDLEGRLLIIQGLQDDVVVPQHSTMFVRKCVEEGIQVDYFPYPTHPHNVRGRDRAHLLGKIARYFEDFL